MSETAHKGQILPLVNQMIPISKDTTFHASYDYGLHGFNQGERVHPIGPERALRFDGSSSYIDIPNTEGDLLDIRGSFSIETWIRPQGFGTYNYILSKNNSGGSADNQYGLYLSSDGKVLNGIVNGSALSANFSFSLNTWYHIKMVYDGSIAKFYVDDVEIGTVAASAPTAYKGNLSIGRRSNSSSGATGLYFFQGEVADLKIYNHKNLVGYWKLSEREGPTAFDSSENGNDAAWRGNVKPGYGRTVVSRTEGKFREAVLIESDTVNLASGVHLGFSGDRWEKTTQYPDGLPVQAKEVYRRKSTNNYWGYFDEFIAKTPSPYQRIFTVSFWYYLEDGYAGNATSSFFGKLATEADSAYSSISTSLQNTFDSNKKNTWQFGYQVVQIDTDAFDYTYFKGWSGGAIEDGGHCYIANFQLEEKEFATSYVLGNRPYAKLEYPSSLINKKEGSIGCWINQYENGGWKRIVTFVTDSIDGESDLNFDILDGLIRLKAKGSTAQLIYAKTSIPINEWHYVSCSWGSEGLKIYVDGVLEGHLADYTDGIAVLDKRFSLGYRLGTSSGALNGMIDELRIEARQISDEEAAAWAASGLHYNYLDYSHYVD